MAWSKPPQSLADLFGACVPDAPGVSQRKMFGFPAAFVNGNMFAGLFEDQMFVRLSTEQAARLTQEHGATVFEPMPGRPMKAYTLVPDAVMDDETAVAELVAAACRFVGGMPPKEKTKRKTP